MFLYNSAFDSAFEHLMKTLYHSLGKEDMYGVVRCYGCQKPGYIREECPDCSV